MPAPVPTRFLAALLTAFAFSAAATAQLTPTKTYSAKGKPVEIEASLPAGLTGEAEIALYERNSTQPIATVKIVPGKLDLATLLPILWSREKPTVLYAQLSVTPSPAPPDQRDQPDQPRARIGSPLVLQPLLTPQRAIAADPRGLSINFTPAGPAYFAGLRVYRDQTAILDTSLGEIELALRPDAAPNTVWNFRELVRGGFYDGSIFHRVIGSATPLLLTPDDDQPQEPPTPPNPAAPPPVKVTTDGFMIQTGDALGTGIGGPGYCIPLEKSPLKHDFGVVSMARLSQPDSAGSQFFISLSRKATAALDGAYASFAQVIRGGDVVLAIGATETHPPDDRPVNPPIIKSIRLTDAPPFGEGLTPASPTQPPER